MSADTKRDEALRLLRLVESVVVAFSYRIDSRPTDAEYLHEVASEMVADVLADVGNAIIALDSEG